MTEELPGLLRQGFALIAKIEQEYPAGEFDREMIHGELDFRYRQVKEDRERLEQLPPAVRNFCRLVAGLAVPAPSIKTFFAVLVREPEFFAAMAELSFAARQEKVGAWAGELGIVPADLALMLSRCRLAGILDATYRLRGEYGPLAAAYQVI